MGRSSYRRSLRALGFVCALVLGLRPPFTCAQDPACAVEAALYLTAPGPAEGRLELLHYTGAEQDFEVTARLRTEFPPSPGNGASGWSISVAHDVEALEILSVTYDGTFGDPELWFGGFANTEIAKSPALGGFVSAIVVTIDPPIELPPVAEVSIARATYRVREVPTPPVGSSPSVVVAAIRYEDGLQGSGQPVSNRVTYLGQTVLPCAESLEVEIQHADSVDFFRGDANHDQALDLSDPVTLLRAHFHGDATIRCDDAGDANDDGALDVSDAIYTFNYLFIGGPEPPAPFPTPGPDPTADDLRCRP